MFDRELSSRIGKLADDVAEFAARMTTGLQELIRKSLEASEPAETSLGADCRKLGEMGWTIPTWGPLSLVRRLTDGSRSAEDIDRIFVEAYSENRGERYREMVSDLRTVDRLQKWEPLIKECDFKILVFHQRIFGQKPSIILL